MNPVISMNELMNRWDLSRPAITKLERCRTFISQLSANMSQFEYEERRKANEDHEDLRTWVDQAKA